VETGRLIGGGRTTETDTATAKGPKSPPVAGFFPTVSESKETPEWLVDVGGTKLDARHAVVSNRLLVSSHFCSVRMTARNGIFAARDGSPRLRECSLLETGIRSRY
jgi:hypothetical protein